MPVREREGQPSSAGSGTGSGRVAAAAPVQLLGSPALCFRRRFNMTFNTASAHSSFIIMVGSAPFGSTTLTIL